MTGSEQRKDEVERLTVEFRLRERERFLRTLIGNLPGVVYRCRVDEKFTSEFISDGCLTLTGYVADELVRDRTASWDEIIHSDDRDRVRAEIRCLMEEHRHSPFFNNAPMQVSYRINARDGALRHVRDRFRFITDQAGEIIALEGFIADITEREIADEKLRESEARYRLLAENMGDLVCLHNPEGLYTYVSPSSANLLGYAPEELIGKSPYEYIHADELGCVRDETHARLLKGETDLTVNYRMRRKSGDYIWLESMAQIIRDEAGATVQLLTVSRDITKRKIAEEERRQAQEEIAQLFLSEQDAHEEAKAARAEAERANRAKDEFLQLISHEFRTPLTTIKTLARIMQQDGETEAERQEYLETISAECDRQIDMILNLLDVARVEEGSIDLRSERVDINQVLKSCDKIERHAANARRQIFTVKYGEDLPPVRGDQKAIRRALCSIIENAIKYTPLGGAIQLSAKRVASVPIAAEANHSKATATEATSSGSSVQVIAEIKTENKTIEEVVVSVSDTGRGIHSEDIPHLFQKFYRGKKIVPHDHTTDGTPDDAMGRAETPGVGLGLYLSKRLIGELGGRIEVCSEVGRGSTFKIYLAVWNDATDRPDLLDEYGFDEGTLR